MADFVQTMKDWRRMCKHYSGEGVSCADMCPLGHNAACGGAMEDALDSDIKDLAEEVAKWAAEHPEPVYPTWGEWLNTYGVVSDNFFSNAKMLDPIPADIAEKLGVKPKEV